MNEVQTDAKEYILLVDESELLDLGTNTPWTIDTTTHALLRTALKLHFHCIVHKTDPHSNLLCKDLHYRTMEIPKAICAPNWIDSISDYNTKDK